MIQSRYKNNLELSIKAGKLAYKLRAKKKDLLINIFVPLALIAMVAILVYDINKGASIILDVVLIALLLVIECVNIFMPFMISHTQKKYFKKMDELNYDYNISEYSKGVFKEKIYKDNKLIYANEVSADRLINYIEFDHYFLCVFDNFAGIIFDIETLENGQLEQLKNIVNSIIINQPKRIKRR